MGQLGKGHLGGLFLMSLSNDFMNYAVKITDKNSKIKMGKLGIPITRVLSAFYLLSVFAVVVSGCVLQFGVIIGKKWMESSWRSEFQQLSGRIQAFQVHL